ncbi:MAG: DUF1963 domain-containing protein [Myxococcales bacterium]|nr:DUF1963 domain-containing protein [Myxococcales bacterium]
MTTPIVQAKALLHSVPYTKALADCVVGYPDHDQSYWTAPRVASSLAESFSYQVAIDGLWLPDRSDLGFGSSFERKKVQITDEDAVPLGASKYRGLPHLPRDMPWPEGLYFCAQLDLDELARVDRSERLPKEGMLYFFYDGGVEAQVIHWSGPVEQLERRPYPDLSTLPDAEYYYERFRVGERIQFNPHWLLVYNEGELYDHSEIRALLPAELVDAVSQALGAPLASFDCMRRIYGRRFDFQEQFEFEDLDEEGEPIFDDPENRVVLLHDQLGDAAIHLWCSPEAAARGDFSGVRVTTSCT